MILAVEDLGPAAFPNTTIDLRGEVIDFSDSHNVDGLYHLGIPTVVSNMHRYRMHIHFDGFYTILGLCPSGKLFSPHGSRMLVNHDAMLIPITIKRVSGYNPDRVTCGGFFNGASFYRECTGLLRGNQPFCATAVDAFREMLLSISSQEMDNYKGELFRVLNEFFSNEFFGRLEGQTHLHLSTLSLTDDILDLLMTMFRLTRGRDLYDYDRSTYSELECFLYDTAHDLHVNVLDELLLFQFNHYDTLANMCAYQGTIPSRTLCKHFYSNCHLLEVNTRPCDWDFSDRFVNPVLNTKLVQPYQWNLIIGTFITFPYQQCEFQMTFPDNRMAFKVDYNCLSWMTYTDVAIARDTARLSRIATSLARLLGQQGVVRQIVMTKSVTEEVVIEIMYEDGRRLDYWFDLVHAAMATHDSLMQYTFPDFPRSNLI